MAIGTGNLPYPGKSYTPFDILTAEELNEDVANIESLATGAGIGDGAVTADKIDWETLSLHTLLTIPYDATKTGSVTTIETPLLFNGKRLRVHYRCFNVAVTSPGSYTVITAVDFSSVLTNTTSVTDIRLIARYAPSADIFTTGGDVAGYQRLGGKLSATTMRFEVWGQYGGATAACGTCMIYEWV